MKIECPKCHQRYGINENYIGQEIECGCGERIRISLTAESATRPKCKASFFQIFVCVYLILILVGVCGGIGWGYSEIRRLNENLYARHAAIGEQLNALAVRCDSIKNDMGKENSQDEKILDALNKWKTPLMMAFDQTKRSAAGYAHISEQVRRMNDQLGDLKEFQKQLNNYLINRDKQQQMRAEPPVTQRREQNEQTPRSPERHMPREDGGKKTLQERLIADVEKNGKACFFVKGRGMESSVGGMGHVERPKDTRVVMANKKYAVVDGILVYRSNSFVDTDKHINDLETELEKQNAKMDAIKQEFDAQKDELVALSGQTNIYIGTSSLSFAAIRNAEDRRRANRLQDNLQRLNKKYLKLNKDKVEMEQDLQYAKRILKSFLEK